MKPVRWILGILGLLFTSYGLDWINHFLQDWTSRTFVIYPLIIFRIFGNLFMMAIALFLGLALAKNPYSRAVALFMVITGLGALILPWASWVPVLPRSLTGGLSILGFNSYLELLGTLLVLAGLISMFRNKKPE